MHFRPFHLDELYKMVAHIYSSQSTHRNVNSTFSHFVEVCGMLTIHDRAKKREGVHTEDALCKALGWFFPLLAQFRVSSVEDLVFHKFPYSCPYCRKCPHDDRNCKTTRGTERSVDHAAARRLYDANASIRPVTLNDWQQMFQDIYPRSVDDKGRGRSSIGLLEELGELGEAIRVFDRYPKYFAGEAADVFSYLMGFANEYSLRIHQKEDRVFAFQDEFLKRYPGLCTECGFSLCACPAIPESTVGRLSKELDLVDVEQFYNLQPDKLAEEGKRISNAVLARLSENNGSEERFPFDRGDTNRETIMLCLTTADEMERTDPVLAASLRKTAIELGAISSYPGSRQRGFAEILIALMPLRNTLQSVGNDLRTKLGPPDSLASYMIGVLTPKRRRVLLVFSNPKGSTPLRLAEEERAIREAIRLSEARSDIELIVLNAATTDDLRRELLLREYHIVHFSGHGTHGKLIFEDCVGDTDQAPLEAISRLIAQYKTIECVIMNACYSLENLNSPMADFTVGMEAPVDDKAAIAFARGFYDALGARKDYEIAIQEGETAVSLKGLIAGLPIKVLRRKAPKPN